MHIHVKNTFAQCQFASRDASDRTSQSREFRRRMVLATVTPSHTIKKRLSRKAGMVTPISNFEADASTVGHNVRDIPPSEPAWGPEVVASPSDPVILHRLYSTMLRVRMIEERASQLAGSGKTQFTDKGREAVYAGSMIELRPGDAIYSDPSIAMSVICEIPLGLLFTDQLDMRSECLTYAPEAPQARIHVIPSSATIAARLNIAAGFALACKLERRSSVVLVHLQDGFNALGFWHEAATLAVAERLPMILVANRDLATANGFGGSELRDRAAGYGMPGIAVDGNDVVAMWRVTQESIHRARSGAGPTLVDAQLTPNAPASNGSATGGDPLLRMQHYLEKRSLWDESWRQRLVREFNAQVNEAESLYRQQTGTQ